MEIKCNAKDVDPSDELCIEYHLNKKHVPLTVDDVRLEDEDVDLLPLELKHYPISIYVLTTVQQLTQTLEMQSKMGMIMDPIRESFMLKRILLTTNFYFLIFSYIFLMSHSIFGWLAFKNDVSFWRKNKSMRGLS